MNITFAVFQSDGTTAGSNGLLKLFSTGPAWSCTISWTILGQRLSSPTNLVLPYSVPTQMNVLLLFDSIFVKASSLKTATDDLRKCQDQDREDSGFS